MLFFICQIQLRPPPSTRDRLAEGEQEGKSYGFNDQLSMNFHFSIV